MISGKYDTPDFNALVSYKLILPKGNTEVNSRRTWVNGAKTFGLINYERGGRISLTELGRQMIDSQFVGCCQIR